MTEVAGAVDTSSRLPDWPFKAPLGYVSICQFDHLLGSGFAPVLEALAASQGDDGISLVVIDPDPSYYRSQYASFPGFRVEPAALRTAYWAGLSREPQGDPSGAIAYTANVVAVVGSTRSWAVWGQRDWELALVLAPAQRGPWLSTGVPFVKSRTEIEELRAPSGWSKPLTHAEVSAFMHNVEQRGSGT
jgi:hypothetical protein